MQSDMAIEIVAPVIFGALEPFALYQALALALTMSEVGRAFGRDRSTVNHACHLIEDMREEQEFDRIIQTIENIVRMSFMCDGTVRR